MGIEDIRLVLPLSSKRRAQLQYHPHAGELHGNRGSKVSTTTILKKKGSAIIHMLESYMGIEDLRLVLPLSSKRRAQLQYHPHARELHGNRGSEVSTTTILLKKGSATVSSTCWRATWE